MRPAADAAATRAVKITLVAREKGDANRPAMETMLAAVRAGAPLGTFNVGDREKETGPVADGWFADVAGTGVETVDATRGVELFLAVKDEDAASQVRKAGHLMARLGRNMWLEKMEATIDEGLSQTNAEMAAHAAAALDKLPDYKLSVDTEDFDYLLAPVVQSGGVYSAAVTTPTLTSTAARFSGDVIIFSAAMRYRQHRCGREGWLTEGGGGADKRNGTRGVPG